jgi:DNA-binding beta-propeller fold protein YncE
LRAPTLRAPTARWIDRCCIQPDALSVQLQCLPVYLAGCANLGAPTGCSGSVLAVSTGTLTLDNIIPVGDPTKNVGPDGLAVSPDGKYVYTATSAYYGLSPEDNWQLVSAISV